MTTMLNQSTGLFCGYVMLVYKVYFIFGTLYRLGYRQRERSDLTWLFLGPICVYRVIKILINALYRAPMHHPEGQRSVTSVYCGAVVDINLRG